MVATLRGLGVLAIIVLAAGLMLHRQWTTEPSQPLDFVGEVRVNRACSLMATEGPTTILLDRGTLVQTLASDRAETSILVLDGPHAGQAGAVANDALR